MNIQFPSLVILTIILNVAGCRTIVDPPEPEISFSMSSGSFANNDSIPVRFSCLNSKAHNPEIKWTPNHKNASSFVLIMNDPDAVQVVGYVWDHWLLYNIPSTVLSIPEGKDQYGPLPLGTMKGKNSAGDTAYAGPCPPPGQKHTYVFRLYCVDIPNLGLQPGATSAQIRAAMKGHITDSIDFKGTFKH